MLCCLRQHQKEQVADERKDNPKKNIRRNKQTIAETHNDHITSYCVSDITYNIQHIRLFILYKNMWMMLMKIKHQHRFHRPQTWICSLIQITVIVYKWFLNCFFVWRISTLLLSLRHLRLIDFLYLELFITIGHILWTKQLIW